MLSFYQDFPLPINALRSDSKLHAYGDSPRIDLLYSSVLESYSVGDRVQACSVVLSLPMKKTKHPDDSVVSILNWLISTAARYTVANPLLDPHSTLPRPQTEEGVYSLLEVPSERFSSSDLSRAALSPASLFDCRSCRKTFARLESLKHHQRTHVRNFICSICYAKFSWPKDLRRHLARHSTEKQFSCPFCQVPFSRKDNLLRHLRSGHHFIYGGNGDNVALVPFTECATPAPSTPSSYPSNKGSSSTDRSQAKRQKLTPGDSWQREEDNEDSSSPFSPNPFPPDQKSSKRKLVCIFHRFNPRLYGNGDTRYQTCKTRGFNYISELRTHLKNVHGIENCGRMPGCAPARESSDQSLLSRREKWFMEYRRHCDSTPGMAETHCIYLGSSIEIRPLPLTLPLVRRDLPTAVVTTPQDNEREPVSVQQISNQLRNVQHANQTLNSHNRQLQSDNENLRTQITFLLQHNESLLRDNQSLREENRGLRAEQRRDPPAQQLPTGSFGEAVHHAFPTSAYPAPADFTSIPENNLSHLDGDDFWQQAPSAAELASSILGSYDNVVESLHPAESSTTAALQALRIPTINASVFQTSLQQTPQLTEGSSRSDVEEPVGNPPLAVLTTPGNRNAGKAPARIIFTTTDENTLNWGS